MTRRWLPLWLALALLLGMTTARAADGAVLQLDRAEIVLDDAAELPGDAAAWQPVTLPDDWSKSRPQSPARAAWYRLRFDRSALAAASLPAIYLPWMRTVGAVYLNRQLVGQYGRFGATGLGPRPQLFVLPPGVLREGENTLHIRLWVAPRFRGILSAVRIGDHAVLQGELDAARLHRVTLRQFGAVFALTLGALMLLIWSRRRHESMYGYVGLAALALVVEKALFHGDVQPLPPAFALPLADVALVATPVLVFTFALRFAGWHWPRTERALWGWAALSWSLIHLTPLAGQEVPGALLNAAWVLPHVAGLALMLWIVRQRPSIESALLAAGHLLSVLALTHGVLVWDRVKGVPWYQVHLVPLLAVMAWIVTRRFVRSIDESERLNRELEDRVATKHAELERQHARTRELEREQAVVQERARLMSDMHDGVGAQLISTLSLVEHGDASKEQVAAALRECIDDLRLAIDSLEPTDGELAPVLGGLRYRLEPRLKAAGIELDWQVRELPVLSCLTPQNVLQVLRILQEAFTNVLKHARARHIRVATAVGAGCVSIEVSDDGRGFDGTPSAHGHGLDNMRQRAKVIGGELRIAPSTAGTTLLLSLPIG
jgi:signal transduction histidine kinase